MRFVVAFRWNHSFHGSMSFFIRTPLRNQPEPPGNSKDMSIDRKDRPVAGKQQGAGYSLGADAFQRGKEQFGFFNRGSSKKRKIE